MTAIRILLALALWGFVVFCVWCLFAINRPDSDHFT